MGAYYIVTDLVVRARFNFVALHAELLRSGLHGLNETPFYKGVWRNGYSSSNRGCRHPAEAVGELVGIIERLGPPARAEWDRCISRRFDMGFQGIDERFASNWQLKSAVLDRVAAVNGELVITIYRPDRPSS